MLEGLQGRRHPALASVLWLGDGAGQSGRRLLRFVRGYPLGAAGGGVVIIIAVLAVFAPLLAPYDPTDVFAAQRLQGPSAEFWLGTDHLGRDILSRVIFGARTSLYVGVASVALTMVLGCIIGVTTAYFGGLLDAIAQRFVDGLMAFPVILLALAIVAALEPSTNNVVIALAVSQAPQAARVVRAQVLVVKQEQYVEAARALGASHFRIMLRHILPQVTAVLLVLGTTYIAWAIVAEATLSFLGAGTPPPTPSWGSMVSGAARTYARSAPWIALFPGIALTLTVFGFNLFGDALRDRFDPRLQRAR